MTTTATIGNFDGLSGYEWLLHTRRDGSNYRIPVDAEDSNMVELQRGETTQMTFVIWDSDLDTDGGGTYGQDTGFTYGEPTGALYGPAPFPSHIERYEALRELGDYAGVVTVNRDINGQVWYRERIGPDATFDSLVVAFEPANNLTATPAFWGAVQGITDRTEYVRDHARVEMDVVVLAEVSDYPDRNALTAALETTI